MHFDFDTKPDNFTRDEEKLIKEEEKVMVDGVNADGRPTISFNRDEGNPTETPPQKPPRHKSSRARVILWWTICIVTVVLVAAFWIRYFNPYSVGAQERGYVNHLECRGFIFKTWEGDLLVSNALADSIRPYMRDFDFSVENNSVADDLMRYKHSAQEVVVTFKRYLGILPWRGEHKYIITSVQPVSGNSDAALHQPVVQETTPPAEEAETTPKADGHTATAPDTTALPTAAAGV